MKQLTLDGREVDLTVPRARRQRARQAVRGSSVKQLTLDGREVDLTKAPRPLNECQREILRVMRASGAIRPVNAGRIVHARRSVRYGQGQHGDRKTSVRQLGCCRFASSDGWDALQRLRKRGLVRNPSRGLWVLV